MRKWILLLLVAGCGSGAVSDPANKPPLPVVLPVSVSPPSATTYSKFPITFQVSGGNGAYIVSSDNQFVTGTITVSNGSFTVVPNTVTVDTSVGLHVRDTVTPIGAIVPLMVKPIASAPLQAQPATIAFQGVAAGTCASDIGADVIVTGGSPPYAISQPAAFAISPIAVSSNPGRFTIRATGQCSSGAQIAVVDSVGAAVSVTASNALSSTPVPTPPTPPAFAVSPTAVALASCTDAARVTLIGGTGSYFATSGNDAVLASVEIGGDGIFRGIMRRNSGETTLASVQVAFSDGQRVIPVTVTLEVTARGLCP